MHSCAAQQTLGTRLTAVKPCERRAACAGSRTAYCNALPSSRIMSTATTSARSETRNGYSLLSSWNSTRQGNSQSSPPSLPPVASLPPGQQSSADPQGALTDRMLNHSYTVRLQEFKRLLTPDVVADMRQTLPEDELQQLDEILAAIKAMDEGGAALPSTSEPASVQPAARKGVGKRQKAQGRTVEMALDLSMQEVKLAHEAALHVQQLPPDFRSYLAVAFPGVSQSEVDHIARVLGTERVSQLASLYSDILLFQDYPTEILAQKYMELSSRMEEMMQEVAGAAEEAAVAATQQHRSQQAGLPLDTDTWSSSHSSNGHLSVAPEDVWGSSPGTGQTPRVAAASTQPGLGSAGDSSSSSSSSSSSKTGRTANGQKQVWGKSLRRQATRAPVSESAGQHSAAPQIASHVDGTPASNRRSPAANSRRSSSSSTSSAHAQTAHHRTPNSDASTRSSIPAQVVDDTQWLGSGRQAEVGGGASSRSADSTFSDQSSTHQVPNPSPGTPQANSSSSTTTTTTSTSRSRAVQAGTPSPLGRVPRARSDRSLFSSRRGSSRQAGGQ